MAGFATSYEGDSLDSISLPENSFKRKAIYALKKIHKLGVIHRDIVGRNIVYNSDTKEIKFIDFGNAALCPIRNRKRDKLFQEECREEIAELKEVLEYEELDFHALGDGEEIELYRTKSGEIHLSPTYKQSCPFAKDAEFEEDSIITLSHKRNSLTEMVSSEDKQLCSNCFHSAVSDATSVSLDSENLHKILVGRYVE